MTYVISSACVDVKHKACVQECPVDCIYEGDRTMYINPDECVECGACQILCEVDAIYFEADLPADEKQFLADNAAFFSQTLPGRDAPIGNPGGADGLGPVGVDTPMVAALPQQ
jgi:NAD-dependent dihydropyrimidine dehydrogenase PreA subunit